MANGSMPHPIQSPTQSPSGAGRRPTHASLHVHVHVHGHCPRGISRTHQFPTYALHCLLCSAQFSLCSARVCSLSELSARGFPASILGSGSSRVRPSGATFTFDFYGQQRQLALNFSSSFIVYAFTYAPNMSRPFSGFPSPPPRPLPVALGTFPF